MGAATLVIFVAVVHRYLSGMPIPVVQDWLLSLNFCWAQELCIYHVRLDGQVRRRLRRAHRHPRRRRRAGQPPEPKNRARFVIFGLLAGALFTGIVGTLGANFVWENGAHYAFFNALRPATSTA